MQNIYKTIDKFITEMKYLENEHVLGAFFFGSQLAGCADQFSDLDLKITLDNSDLEHYVVGRKYVDGIRIQYQEIPLKVAYAKVQTQWSMGCAFYKSVLGKSEILFDKTGCLKQLKEYALKKYSNMLPEVDESKLKLSVYELDSDVEVLKRAAFKNSPDFLSLYFYTVDEIRRLYHKINCISVIHLKKSYRAYTDDAYRKILSMANPDEKFVSMYLDLISDNQSATEEKLNNVIDFYNYVKKDFDWNEKDYRIVLDI